MADHVKRLVNGWYDSAAAGASTEREGELLTPLVDGIYRLIREAEKRTRDRCIGALPVEIDPSTRNQVVEAIKTLELQGKLGRRTPRDRRTD